MVVCWCWYFFTVDGNLWCFFVVCIEGTMTCKSPSPAIPAFPYTKIKILEMVKGYQSITPTLFRIRRTGEKVDDPDEKGRLITLRYVIIISIVVFLCVLLPYINSGAVSV